jgi:CheY-like chemotaxis protein
MAWRVVVVDDDVAVPMSLSFSDEAVEVTDANRLSDGFEIATRGDFDVAIIDRRMPDGDGLELVRKLRGEPATATLPIIVLTASHDESDRDEVLLSGADEYLAKPIEPSALVAAFRRVAGAPIAGDEVITEKHKKRGHLLHRKERPEPIPEAEPDLPPPASVTPIESAEHTLLRERDAANARAAHAIVETTELSAQIASLRQETEDLTAELAICIAVRESMATHATAMFQELATARKSLVESSDQVQGHEGTIVKLQQKLAQSEAANAELCAEADRRSQQSASIDLRAGAKKIIDRARGPHGTLPS